MAQPFDVESSATRASASGVAHSDTSGLERLAEIAARTAEETGKFANIEAILRIPVTVQVVLGSATIPVANLMKLGRGAVSIDLSAVMILLSSIKVREPRPVRLAQVGARHGLHRQRD